VVIQQFIFERGLSERGHLILAHYVLHLSRDVLMLFDTLHHTVQGGEVICVQGELRVHVCTQLHRPSAFTLGHKVVIVA